MDIKSIKNKKNLRTKEEILKDLRQENHPNPEIAYEQLIKIRSDFDHNEEKQFMVSFLNSIGNKVDRFKMVELLGQKKQSNSDLQDKLNKKQPAVSHQLKMLVQDGIIQGEKKGKYTYYSLNRLKFEDMANILTKWIDEASNWFGELSA
ncbi:hypothetical protein NEF87_004606 [Candidatus Lokiarchaeum ossiferum]|uniref:HTH arsR-type domain-containing protein n=1 Tax=Candidatus Lokiarchaeum ossiferum TaxID=2951803 RepID=A0ABY6HYA1_9ARCH|nr:hypothetical protein NEF87_004606 [Candidatus Lokiarchaeum sp. B-35]